MVPIYSSIVQDSWSLRVKEGPDFFSTDENKKNIPYRGLLVFNF